MIKRFLIPVIAAFIGVSICVGLSDAQARSIKFLRDAESETVLRMLAKPVFEAAGLDPEAIQVYIVNDDGINAFVANGQKLFINTGLLKTADNAEQVIGVIAHEAGHIAGGHLVRTHEKLGGMTAQAILGYVLGGAAALATGRGDVAGAVIAGADQINRRSFLQYSRGQEASADQAALSYLDEIGVSAEGLAQFFHKLEGEELLSVGRQSSYVRTHPLTRTRIDAVEEHVRHSPHSNKKMTEQFDTMFQRVRGKLRGYTDSIVYTLRTYPESDQSVEARYARAHAYWRKPDLSKALSITDSLLAEAPDDPFYLELKALILFENGRVQEAIAPYEKAVEKFPTSGLLRAELARVQIESGDPAKLEDAVSNLRVATRQDPERSFNWRLMAIAQGRLGDEAQSALALAQEAYVLRRKADARYQAGKAAKMLPRGSPGWLQAQDILNAVRKKKDD